MEGESSESTSSSDLQSMDQCLEFIFTSIISQGDMLDAIEFIRSIEAQILPSKDIVRILIFKILMKNDDIRTLAYTADYLSTVIDVYPPVNEERRKFYFDSIRDNHGFLADFWTVFNHIVNSYFIQHNIYVFEEEGSSSDPIKYPNCKFLLEFYVKLLVVDFEHYNSNSTALCLVMKLFWPNSDIIRTICLSNRTDLLLKWINDIYASAFVNSMGDFLKSMHQVLTLVIRSVIERKYSLSQYAAFSSPHLPEIVEAIINFCKDAFSTVSNVKKFLSFVPLKYLRAKVCEKLIKNIIKVPSKRYSVLTLKDIVDQCMFPSRFNKFKNNKPPIHKEKVLRRRKYFADMKMETTKLHEFCKKNKFADMFEELKSSVVDINARDPAGNTPLHEACSVASRICVRHLIDEGFNQPLDFDAVNLEGITPLHIAVMNDFVDIAKMLLSHGGAYLLTIPDNKGQVPADLSNSDSMTNLLQVYDMKLKDSALKESTESDSSTESRSKDIHTSAPVLKVFKDYSIYLDALNCLLCTYCDMFNLIDYVWQKDTIVSNHSKRVCCHFTDKDVCSEDATTITGMSSLLDTFIESIIKNASKYELNIDIELIPLKGFAASLKTG